MVEIAQPNPYTFGRGWQDRVSFSSGPVPYAYVPNQILVLLNQNRGLTLDDITALAGARDITPEGVKSHFVLEVTDDVPSVVLRLRGAGIQAQPNHVFFAHNVYGNPVHGTPVHGTPVHGTPVHGTPVHGTPVHGTPVHGTSLQYGCGCVSIAACDCSDPCAPWPTVYADSMVYPDPLFAENVYCQTVAAEMRATGNRRSQIRAAMKNGDAFTSPNDWATATVVVSILDTGFDLVGNQNALDRTPYVGNINTDADTADKDGNKLLDPIAGHGTFIAGIVAALAPKAAVRVYRVLSPEGDGNESAIATAIETAVTAAKGKKHFLNLSFGAYILDEPGVLAAAIHKARLAGTVVVASAGNDYTCRPAYPAAFVGVVSVAALGPNGPAPFSNYGPWVRACAPGVDLLAPFFFANGTWSVDPNSDPKAFEGWGKWSGTSFSAPVVAAVLARSAEEFAESPDSAVTRVIDDPQRTRLAHYGTVVNESPLWK